MKLNALTIDSTKSISDLCLLGEKYPTDKSPYSKEDNGSGHNHAYTAIYDLLFASIRYKDIKIAEIGILNNMSMLCWREYFPHAKLFGFEYNLTFLENGKSSNLNNTIYDFINITDEASIEKCMIDYGKFDIIIEDSTHRFEDQIRLIDVAHKYLNTGGILIIEDIFKNEDENKYSNNMINISEYYSTITFINADHNLKNSPGWNNDKLLILIRNEK